MEPLDYLKAIASRWRIVLACVLVSVTGALLTAPAADAPSPATFRSWTAASTLLADPAANRNLAYTRLFMQRGELPELVAQALGGTEPGPQVASRVNLAVDDTVGTITISATADDAASVETLVNTYADQSIAFFDRQVAADVEGQLASLQQRIDATGEELARLDDAVASNGGSSLLEAQRGATQSQYQALLQQQQAVAAEAGRTSGLSILERGVALEQTTGGFTPPSSRTSRALLGLVAGLLLGAVLALVVDRLDTRVKSRDEVQDVTGAPVIATVPRLPARMRRTAEPLVVTEPGDEFAETHRSLRSAMSLLPARPLATLREAVGSRAERPGPHQVVLVVSAGPSEGKSTTVVNLAATLAAAGRSVVLVDADLHSPTLGRRLGVPAGPGLADLASGDSSMDGDPVAALLRQTSVPGVRLLDAGSIERFPSISPSRMARVVGALRESADTVLIDVSPLLTSSDALDLVPQADAVLLVVRANRTTRDKLRLAAEILARTQVPVLGAVLVGVPRPVVRRGTRGSTSLGRAKRHRVGSETGEGELT